MISIAVCDDEILLQHALSARVYDYLKRNRLNGKVTGFSRGEDIVGKSSSFDIVLLDIEMPGINGMQTAIELREQGKDSQIIFVTSHSSYVFDAFNVDASNFLVKPVTDKKLFSVMDKAVKRILKNDDSDRVSAAEKEDGGMSNPHGIIVFGANGSGKSTLGRELAHILKFKHMDIEDYHFEKSDIPYTVERSSESCLSLMLADIETYGSFVLSAVTGDFGDKIPQFYELAVFISAPIELRIKRIEQRAYERHGERIRKGGDMYERHLKFVDFVSSRTLSGIEQWADSLSCPIIHVDGTVDWRTNAANIKQLM